MKTLSKLSKHNLVRSLPNIKYDKDKICDACVKGKNTKYSLHSKSAVLSHKVLELLHIDIFGPTKTLSLSGKRYGFVIVDDFSRFTWVLFLSHKKVQNEKEFENCLCKE